MHPNNPKYPKPTSPVTTKVMKAIKRADTKPEMLVRSALHKKGLRFRKDLLVRTRERNCRPDIAFTKHKIAIFIDGCFWHFCPEHGHIPKSNVAYWEEKFKKNSERDKRDTKALKNEGWTVIRFWEHTTVEEIASQIEYVVKGRQIKSERKY